MLEYKLIVAIQDELSREPIAAKGLVELLDKASN
jgi:hypothetical protein